MLRSGALRLRSSSNPLGFALHRFKKRAAQAIAYTADWALFIGVVLILGLGSSWYMIEHGSPLTTTTSGPWVSWVSAARVGSDPYTRAHEARLGILPLSTEVGQTFVARTDSEGRALHSSCDYTVEGHELQSHWWSLTVFDSHGRLVPNTLDRFAYTSDTMAIRGDGTFVATLSRDAYPGNWLPIGGAGRLALAFTVVDYGARSLAGDSEVQDYLPTITRKDC